MLTSFDCFSPPCHMNSFAEFLHGESRVGRKTCPVKLYSTILPILRFQRFSVACLKGNIQIPFWKFELMHIWPWCQGYREGKPLNAPSSLYFLFSFIFGSIGHGRRCSLACIVSLGVSNNAVCHHALHFTECFHPRYVVNMLWKHQVLCRYV